MNSKTYNQEEVKMLMRFAYNKGVMMARKEVKSIQQDQVRKILNEERERCIDEYLGQQLVH